ncbi:hypothetical protein P4V41_07675 [Fictibacillus nanhaiensis]|uniref:hypothetical protein n=1 Tax=Fictibacillus nanhaiensis TaxID=742169 RepID=UPI002E1AECA6|nr:hypothetical protein [Fictibacillus nanhaiensis]
MYYVYENHLDGSFYISDQSYNFEELYCDRCGDSDRLIEEFDREEEALKFVNNEEDL